MQDQSLRGVLVTVSSLLSDIIRDALSRGVKFQLVAELEDRQHLVERLTELHPDLVVIGLDAGESDEIGAKLLLAMPAGKVLLVSGAGDYAYLYEMSPHRSVLHDFSPENLLTAVVGGLER